MHETPQNKRNDGMAAASIPAASTNDPSESRQNGRGFDGSTDSCARECAHAGADYQRFKKRENWWERRRARVAAGFVPRQPLGIQVDDDPLADISAPELRRLLNILGAAKSRCCNPNVYNYGNYGGRGITFSDAFIGREGARRFLVEVGPRPSSDHQIDRIDNDRGYEPGNVRWATRKQQRANRRDSFKPLAKASP